MIVNERHGSHQLHANNVQIGGEATVTIKTVDATVTANAKSITYNETTYNSGDEFAVTVGDTITIAPSGLTVKTPTPYESGVILSDIRTAVIGGNGYAYDTLNVKNACAPLVYNEETKSFTYVVDANDIVDGKLDITIVFDRYCKITIEDEYLAKPEVDYKWTDETKGWGKTITAYDGIQYGNSGSQKVLMGYARKDIGIDIETDEEIVRDDGFTFNYKSIGLYYTKFAIGDVGNANIKNDANKVNAYTIVPDMIFERIYVEYKVDYEIKFETMANDINTVNEERSGLRFVVQFNKADFAKYKHYSKETNDAGLSSTSFYHYFTTKSQLDKIGYTGTLTAIGTKWMTSGSWDAKLGQSNGLGLTCISLNGAKPEGTVTGTGGFGVIKLQESSTNNMWHETIASVDYDKYLAYAITFHSFKDASQTYIMSIMINAGYSGGGSTGLMCAPIEICLKDLCEDKYTDNLLTAAPESGTSYGFKIGEDTYYSTLTRAHMQWLATKAGLGVTLEELPKVEA